MMYSPGGRPEQSKTWFAAMSETSDGGVYEVPRTLQDRIVEPSPEMASFSRYTDFPVSYSTGTAQVKVPLAEWKSGTLDMSLSGETVYGFSVGSVVVDTDIQVGFRQLV